MGWVSCLEDAQERLDNIYNFVQGLKTEIGSPTWYEVNRISQILKDLQSQHDKLVEVATDPEIGSKIELYELKEAYEQMKLQNQNLQFTLSEEQYRNLENSEIIKAMNVQLSEMAKSLKTERDISEHWTAKYYEEQNRRERAEAELEKLKRVVSSDKSSKKQSNRK